jgi:hypothetical protein
MYAATANGSSAARPREQPQITHIKPKVATNSSRATSTNQKTLNRLNGKLTESGGTPVKPAGTVSREFVTETFEYDRGRQVTFYVRPDPVRMRIKDD